MIVKVTPHKVEIVNSEPINEKEVNVSKCIFEFEDIEDNLVKEAYFTLNGGTTYKQIIQNNECNYPSEVLTEKGELEIGVSVFKVEDEEYIKLYNPTPAYFTTWKGSLKEAENSVPVTPSDKEQMEQAISDMETKVDNLDIEAEKVDKTTTITITRKDGTQEEVEVLDGISLLYNWLGTSLGIKREDEESYIYVDLKGEKGDAGAIKMIIVNELPATGQEDTIYLVPLETPESQENKYAEYVYIDNAWELLGKIGIEVDLSDYAKKSELPTALSQLSDDSTHRLVTDEDKSNWNGKQNTINENNKLPYSYISGTPTIPSKTSDLTNDSDYTTKTYVDGLVGNVESILEELDIGGGI